jgi:hypothetical protein
MDLTDAEGKGFWPIYEAYQKDLQGINERIGKAIQAYADAYNSKALTDAQAKQLIDEVLAIDQEELNLRKAYTAKLDQVLPGKKVARYIQIEIKISDAIIPSAGSRSMPAFELCNKERLAEPDFLNRSWRKREGWCSFRQISTAFSSSQLLDGRLSHTAGRNAEHISINGG